ncbi:hypothetical protein HNR77_004696 [Paenibacillus sp. JGP012]|uniref:TniQ family protein n=1 Tax=Paenibacillus sp. JGP012 TaxID=2735914 RepID=UPI0016116E5E|nr:TniQ family protein [Paenibacillus sp. JGP012]MBB6023595.1 hypothetical protein [Paenibacillus sp. JGP012]
MEDILTIKTRPYNGESLTAFLMRTAVRNQMSYQSLLHFADIKSTRSHHLDFNPKYITNLDKLTHLLETDKTVFRHTSFSHIVELFIDENEQYSISYNDFFFNLFNRRYRRFCPLCLEEKNSYLLFWQVNDLKVCIHHGINITSKCPSCSRDQPYISPSLVQRECYSCGEKLTKFNHRLQKTSIEPSKEQYELNSLWCDLQNTDLELEYEKVKPKSKYLALLILFICSGKRELFDQSRVEFLTTDLKSRLLSFYDRGQGSRPTLGQLINLVLSMKIGISDLLRIEIPTQFIESVNQYNMRSSEIPICQSPWCPSYHKDETMVRTNMNIFKWEGIIYSTVFMCSCCYVKYARKGNQNFTEVGESYLWAWDKVLPLLMKNKFEQDIAKSLNLTRYKVLKYSVYFSVKGQLDIKLTKNTPKNPIGHPIEHFKKLDATGSSLISQASQRYRWGQRVYFYYFFNPEVQLHLFDAVELETKPTNKKKLVRKRITKPAVNLSKLPEKNSLLNEIRNYIQIKNELFESIFDAQLYHFLNTTRKTMLKYYPDIVEYIEEEKAKQKMSQTRSLEDERIERIKESFDLIKAHGEYPSYERIVEVSEVPKKYIITHPRVKEIFLNLRREYIEGN